MAEQLSAISHNWEKKVCPEATEFWEKFKYPSWIISSDVAADLANDVDEISSLEVQLVGLVGRAVP